MIERGLSDIANGTESTFAFLVAIGAPRLRRQGLPIPPAEQLPLHPEHRLFEALSQEGRGAHSRYNALIRRLVSFERALEFQQTRERRRRLTE
jgi:hypothetical protein